MHQRHENLIESEIFIILLKSIKIDFIKKAEWIHGSDLSKI